MSEERIVELDQYAAIVIPTLNRYEHFVECIESLLASPCARYTELYVGVDYPPAEKYVEGNQRIKEYLCDGIEGFAHTYIYNHEINLGADKNIEFLINEVIKTHETFIFTEDDNVFSSNYLEYINRALCEYHSDPSVVAISGYNYPMSKVGSSEEIYFNSTYFAAFGFATWKDKFFKMREEMSVNWIHNVYNNRKFMRLLGKKTPNQFCNFVKAMVEYTTPIEREDGVWKMDMTYGVYMACNNLRMVFPAISKVKNNGYDGSGVNCDVMTFDADKKVSHRNFIPEAQNIDADNRCEKIIAVSASEEQAYLDEVNSFFEIPKSEYVRTYLTYVISRIIGINRVRNIMRKIK